MFNAIGEILAVAVVSLVLAWCIVVTFTDAAVHEATLAPVRSASLDR